MMKINFNKYVTGKNRAKVRSAANFFMKELLSARKASNTFVEIRLLDLQGAHGFCSLHEDEGDLYSPKSFTIDIDGKMSVRQILETLAHEMIHMRQFRNKELGYRENHTLFRGRAYRLDMPYHKEPWEKEAYRKEGPLLAKFLKEYKA